jgi:hypothetical protein
VNQYDERRVVILEPTPRGSLMPSPVIVATACSPISRAFKGCMVDVRPDDLAAQIVKAALAKVPQLDPGEGDVFIAAGVEMTSCFIKGNSDSLPESTSSNSTRCSPPGSSPAPATWASAGTSSTSTAARLSLMRECGFESPTLARNSGCPAGAFMEDNPIRGYEHPSYWTPRPSGHDPRRYEQPHAVESR